MPALILTKVFTAIFSTASILLPIIQGVDVKPIVLNVKEEVAAGSVVLNFSTISTGSGNELVNISKWRLLRSGESLFGIDTRRGVLFVRERIDLESFCQQFSVCCSNQRNVAPGSATPNDCTLNLLLDQGQQLTPLAVVVHDVNEFVPRFAQTTINISVFENSGEQQIRVPMPRDDDATSSRFVDVHVVYLDGNTPEREVSSAVRRIDTYSSTEIRLPLVDRPSSTSANNRFELDRERKEVYRYRVVACEPNSTTRCGNAMVTLTVLDVNDNKPSFNRSEYEVTVQENTLTHSALLHVSASDADVAENGEVQYSIEPASIKCVAPGSPICRRPRDLDADEDQSEHFVVNDDGWVMLNRQLDFENCTQWTFRVQASDRGSHPLTGFADVNLRVVDMDDTKPCARLEPAVDFVEIEETAPDRPRRPFSRLPPVIMVSDPDTPKSNVQCRVAIDNSLQVIEMPLGGSPYEKTYQIVPTRTFDREAEEMHSVRLECSDSNFTEVYYTEFGFHLLVTDVNDNPPVFPASRINASLTENSPPGTHITTLVASDRDAGDNALVHYSLLQPSPYVAVDSNGVVRSLVSVDRETVPLFEAVVVARDRGSPSLSSTATLAIFIEDENDSAPTFERQSYEFRIEEDVQPSNGQHYMGEVRAKDADAESALVYTLLNGTEYFLITAQAGSLFLQRPIDREVFDRYTFVVAVSDADGIHTSTVPVHITVIDANDNTPRILYPSKTNSTIKVACPRDVSPNGAKIYQASAVDDDATAEHRQIEFRLEITNPANSTNSTFRIDSSTGEIFYMLQSCKLSYALKVIAIDASNPQLRSEQSLQVLFIIDPDGGRDWDSSRSSFANDYRAGSRSIGISGFTSHQLMIILATTLVILLVAFVVLLLVFIRVSKRGSNARKDRRKAHESHAQQHAHAPHGNIRSQRVNQCEDDAASGIQEAPQLDGSFSEHEHECDEQFEAIYEDGDLSCNYSSANVNNNGPICEKICTSIGSSVRVASRSVCDSPQGSVMKSGAALPILYNAMHANQYCDSTMPARWSSNNNNEAAAFYRPPNVCSRSPSPTMRTFAATPASAAYFASMRSHGSSSVDPAAVHAHHQTMQYRSQNSQPWHHSSPPQRCLPLVKTLPQKQSHYETTGATQPIAFQDNSARSAMVDYKMMPQSTSHTSQRSMLGDKNSFV